MRITHEADYAIRIMYCLAERNQTISAKQISDDSGVPSRFALKILRRLTQAGLTESFKGVSGGYQLARTAEQISLGEIIEVIDGPIEINHCLSSEFDCSRVQQKMNAHFTGCSAQSIRTSAANYMTCLCHSSCRRKIRHNNYILSSNTRYYTILFRRT